MHVVKISALVLAALAATGCPSSDEPSLGGDVVGRWRTLPNAAADDPQADPAVTEFRADGTYEVTGGAGPDTGTWEVDGDLITVTSDEAGLVGPIAYSFQATADRLRLPAYTPEGDHDGFVGTWHNTVNLTVTWEGQTSTALGEGTLAIRADGTASQRYDVEVVGAPEQPPPPEEDEGTWRAVGDDIVITLDSELVLPLRLEDGVLAPTAERIE